MLAGENISVQSGLPSCRQGCGAISELLSARAQRLLGIPDPFAVAAVMPLGKPVKQLTRLTRVAEDELIRLEHWQGVLSWASLKLNA